MRAALALAVVAGACGGAPRHASHPQRTMDITRAALPFRVLRAQGGAEVDVDTFYGELMAARAVCLAEHHPNPHHHWAQLEITSELVRRVVASGAVELALGLEMIARPFQGVLDDWAAGRIDDAAFLARTGWRKRWGYDFGFYRPTMRAAAGARFPLLALNAPKELTRKIGRQGLGALGPDERAQLPELDLADERHKAYFQEAMGDHEAPGGLDNLYAAQVTWDETMADGAARWLGSPAAAQAPRLIVILAGSGHCHDAAIPARIRRRGAEPAVSVLPVLDTGQGETAEALAAPAADYLFVMTATVGASD